MSLNDLETLLATCTGNGTVVACSPDFDDGLFFVGTRATGEPSLLDALWSALGGTTEGGSQRYEIALLVSAGVAERPNNVDDTARGAYWLRPPADHGGAAAVQASRRDPRRQSQDRTTALSRTPERQAHSALFPDGLFAERARWVQEQIHALKHSAKRALFLLEADVFVRCSSTDFPQRTEAHAKTEAYLERLSLELKGSQIDVVIFSFKTSTITDLLNDGLPRRPTGMHPDQPWPKMRIDAQEIHYPRGDMEWSNSFAKSERNAAIAVEQLSLVPLAPVAAPPSFPKKNTPDQFDWAFWRDVLARKQELKRALAREYFLDDLVITLTSGRETSNPFDLVFEGVETILQRLEGPLPEEIVSSVWSPATTLWLDGAPGTGKTLLVGKLMKLLYGSHTPSSYTRDCSGSVEKAIAAVKGAANGFVDSKATDVYNSIRSASGYAVLQLTEMDKDEKGVSGDYLSPEVTTAKANLLLDTTETKRLTPANSTLHAAPLMNGIVVFTSNQYKPTGPIKRRVNLISYATPTGESNRKFLLWWMRSEAATFLPDRRTLDVLDWRELCVSTAVDNRANLRAMFEQHGGALRVSVLDAASRCDDTAVNITEALARWARDAGFWHKR